MKLSEMLLPEFDNEMANTRKTLERIPEDKLDWKPHEKSMQMGYLALIVADIPKWITAIVKTGVVDFATWEHDTASTGEEFVSLFDKNMTEALAILKETPDEEKSGRVGKQCGRPIRESSQTGI